MVLKFLIQLLKSITNFDLFICITIYYDNASHLVKNPIQYQRLKHCQSTISLSLVSVQTIHIFHIQKSTDELNETEYIYNNALVFTNGIIVN